MVKDSDRRRFWRAAFHSSVLLAAASGNTAAQLIDISLKGALVEVPPTWNARIDDSCQIKLKLADDASILMHAVVAHVEGARIGLRCEHMDVDSITHLRRLVELNSGDPDLLDRELAVLLQNPA